MVGIFIGTNYLHAKCQDEIYIDGFYVLHYIRYENVTYFIELNDCQ